MIKSRSSYALETGTTILLCGLLGASVLGNSLVAASLCQIGNVSVNYPKPVLPNQRIQLSTVVSGICSPAEQQIFYTARVDIDDTVTNQVLSMTSVPIGYLVLQQPNFAVTVPNYVTAPSAVVAWQLTVIVYIFANFEFTANGIDTSTVTGVTIQVGIVQTTTTMSSIQASAAAVTATSSTSTTSQPTSSLLETPPVEPIDQQIQFIILLAASAIIIIVALTFLFKSRRSRMQTAS